jgi:hypothetical protein
VQSKLELGRAVMATKQNEIPLSQLTEIQDLIARANCQGGDVGNIAEIAQIQGTLESRIAGFGRSGSNERVAVVKKLVAFVGKNMVRPFVL